MLGRVSLSFVSSRVSLIFFSFFVIIVIESELNLPFITRSLQLSDNTVNKCSVFICSTSYGSNETPSMVATFHFPLKNEDLLNKWILFDNRKNWKPPSCSVLCEKHFREEVITRDKRTTPKWSMDPYQQVT